MKEHYTGKKFHNSSIPAKRFIFQEMKNYVLFIKEDKGSEAKISHCVILLNPKNEKKVSLQRGNFSFSDILINVAKKHMIFNATFSFFKYLTYFMQQNVPLSWSCSQYLRFYSNRYLLLYRMKDSF